MPKGGLVYIHLLDRILLYGLLMHPPYLFTFYDYVVRETPYEVKSLTYKKTKVLLFIHGGLNGLSTARARVARLKHFQPGFDLSERLGLRI